MPSPARLTPINPKKPKNESALDKLSQIETNSLPATQLTTYNFVGARNNNKFLTA